MSDDTFDRALEWARTGTLTPDVNGTLRYGYDGNIRRFDEEGFGTLPFSAEERMQIAQIMVIHWTDWAKGKFDAR